MGILSDSHSARVLTLPGHCLIGRSGACYLRLADRQVSAEHARLRWVGGTWELRDLGSRNGLTVNGRAVPRGEAVVLALGDEVAFSDAQRWRLIDASGPVAAARDPESGTVRTARDGLLVFSEADPFPYIHRVADDEWMLEEADGQRLVRDGEAVIAAGKSWWLHLPQAVAGTEDCDPRGLWLGALTWHFTVSRDEEFVSVTLDAPGERIDLGARAHHYLLLVLARERRDSDGWVYTDTLCRMLAMDERHINVQVYRARAELGQRAVVNASDLLERRRSTRQLRVGITRFDETVA